MLIESGTNGAAGAAMGLSSVLIMLGAFLKHQTPIDNNWIPLILLVVGTVAYSAMAWPLDLNGAVMAIGSALSAVGIHTGTRSTINAATK